MVSVPVMVPEGRVGEFYVLVGDFLASAPARRSQAQKRAPAPSRRSRYAALSEFLSGFSGDATELSFAEVEEVLGAPLPVSARRHRAYWSNSGETIQGRSWTSVGWKVGELDWGGQRVRCERGDA